MGRRPPDAHPWRVRGRDLGPEGAVDPFGAGSHRLRTAVLHAERLYGGSASDLNGVLAPVDSVPDLDDEWIADLLTANTAHPERTPFPGVSRVAARHVVVASEKGTRTRAFWDLERSPHPAYASAGQYEDELRDRLAGAVRASMPYDDRLVGCELSGGIDSSAVTALVASETRERGAEMIAFTHVLADDLLGVVWPFEDERALAAALRRHAGIDRHVHVTAHGYDIIESLRTSIVAQGAPSNGTYDLFSDALCDEAGSHAATSLYSGFGGDEMVSGTGSLVPERWIRRGELRRLLWRLPGASRPPVTGWRRRLLSSSARYWLSPTGRGSRAREALAQGRRFTHSLVERLPVSSDFAERWELRERAMAQWQALAEAAAGSDNESLERHQTLRASTAMRLEACNVAAAGRGVAYRYPLLDVSLLEWFHSVPAEQKWGAGWGRYLFRRSFTGVVPDELLWRNAPAQTNTIPNLVGRYKASEASIRAVDLPRTCPARIGVPRLRETGPVGRLFLCLRVGTSRLRCVGDPGTGQVRALARLAAVLRDAQWRVAAGLTGRVRRCQGFARTTRARRTGAVLTREPEAA